MTIQIPTLDGTSLLVTSFSGFNYPQNAQVVSLLSAVPGSGGNAVLQQSGLPFRQAAIEWSAESADVATVRTLYESRDAVQYVDFEGNAKTVRVLDFASSLSGNGLWSCTALLIETDEVLGS